MLKQWLLSKAWLVSLVFLFFICNFIFWTYNSRGVCDDDGNCSYGSEHKPSILEGESNQRLPADRYIPLPPPPPPPPPPPQPQALPPQPPAPAEAKLEAAMTSINQPIKAPKTFIPEQHTETAQDLDLIAPTTDQITMRLKGGNELAYAQPLEAWNIGIINSKPDVFIAADGHLADLHNHYLREHRIYTLMKWILRIHRRDPSRSDPLLMVDAGSNHGLFSMVASVSGAHTIAFEPQTHLRSIIGLGARLNQVPDRLRVLPFAVLDKYRKISMSNYNINDGGIGFLDFSNKDTIMQTQTIRLDNLPAFDLLFTGTDKTLINSPKEISAVYANALEASTKNNGEAVGMKESMLLNQPIHFLKIDVEGFELQALESATRLFESGLVEHCVLEFGPPNRWDVTVENNNQELTLEQIRSRTINNSKRILHQVTEEWDMDIYLLPAIGWEKTVSWMLNRGVSFNKNNLPNKNKIVHRLMAWDFDGRPKDMDEFEAELEAKGGLITEVIPLPEDLIDDYMDSLESLGEMYLWFVKRNGHSAVLEKLEL